MLICLLLILIFGESGIKEEKNIFFKIVLVLNDKLMILIRSFFKDIVNNGLTRINNLCYEYV